MFETLDGFRVDANAGVIPPTGKAEPQIWPPPGMVDGALFEVDCQLETSFNEHHPDLSG
jgi:hypothetical protein